MKQRYLLDHLRQQGCPLLREGVEHSILKNPAHGRRTAIPRHREINDFTAAGIGRPLGVPFPSI